jgi:hypothetical protein
LPIHLPRDDGGAPLQVVIGTGTRVNLTAGVASSNAALPAGTSRFVLIRSSDFVWLNFGTSGVTAAANNTSILCAPGEGVYAVASSATHVAVLRVGAADVPVQAESIR